MQLIIIQHTQSVHHTNKMIGAHTNWELTSKGVSDAISIANYLDTLDLQDFKLISSDLMRAKQVAEIISRKLNLKVSYCKKLREVDLGEATGKSVSWFNEYKTKETEDMFSYKPFPSAESNYDLYIRMSSVRQELIKRNENVIIVSHGGAINFLIRSFISEDINIAKSISFRGSAGGITIASYDEGFKINKFNQQI